MDHLYIKDKLFSSLLSTKLSIRQSHAHLRRRIIYSSCAHPAVALAVLVLRGAALRRGMGQIIFRDEATGRLRAVTSSPRRAAEWLVLRYPQAVRTRVAEKIRSLTSTFSQMAGLGG